MSSEEVCRRTGRTLKEILKEHTYAVKLANMNNGITAHLIDWDYSAKVRKQKRKVIEAIHIKSMPRTSNPRLWTVPPPHVWLLILQPK